MNEKKVKVLRMNSFPGIKTSYQKKYINKFKIKKNVFKSKAFSAFNDLSIDAVRKAFNIGIEILDI